MAEKKPWVEQTGTFTIKTVEGTGSRAQYYRIADSLVRNSRIFRHLCKRIYRLKGLAGLQKKYRLTHLYRLKDKSKEHNQFVRDANRVLKQQERTIIRLENHVKRLREKNKAGINRLKDVVFKYNRVMGKQDTLEAKFKRVKTAEKYFSQTITWSTNYITGIDKSELILRAVYNYASGEQRNQFKMHEVMILGIGYQLDAFGEEQLENRFGSFLTKDYRNHIADLVIKGYIRRFTKREMYFLTDKGKERFEQIMELIIKKKSSPYWLPIFDKLRDNDKNGNGKLSS